MLVQAQTHIKPIQVQTQEFPHPPIKIRHPKKKHQATPEITINPGGAKTERTKKLHIQPKNQQPKPHFLGKEETAKIQGYCEQPLQLGCPKEEQDREAEALEE